MTPCAGVMSCPDHELQMQNGGTAEAAKRKEHDESGLANNPFPSTPPGMMGSSGYNLGALAADPNRAFQTINAETLEAASKTAEFQEPTQGVTCTDPGLAPGICLPGNSRHGCDMCAS